MKSHVKRATEIINQLKRNDLTPARRIELIQKAEKEESPRYSNSSLT